MNRKIESRFLANYVLMFIISIMIALFALMLLGFTNDVISKTLAKNNYTAESLMKDDYKRIDVEQVIYNGGGVQVINTDYEVAYSLGLNTISKGKLTTAEFTDFLMKSKSIERRYSYSIKYNSKKQFWLVVTFPTSIRIDLNFVYNKEYNSVDKQGVVGVIVAVTLLYFILLAICTVIYSKLSSISIISPLKKLCHSASRLKDGDYSSRVELNLKNEFGELEYIFNEMAEQIEQEIYLRNQSEENRKRLILNISHDLKNPLASIMGYAEFSYNKPDLSKEEYRTYMKVICENSVRVNNLVTNLFELSKMESSKYLLNKTRVDICEYMREEIGFFITTFDKAQFTYDFEIPEKEIFIDIDLKQMNRVIQNLVSNTIKYNPKGTLLMISLFEQGDGVVIIFKDNGIGMPSEIAKDIFNPFFVSNKNWKYLRKQTKYL
ncbi:HAMP domain-containing histidine kinase [Clostridium sp. CM027]|uniref:HAMP domain-containing sensor histidine kinase n=1 Tax=Clostridium sp. CM027 TaxID=2849865 RepID=UPI001C6E72CE|nr:HAMP domain-containing sensor histidine kinase [Clostridium sp. CM027]MBW9146722.1 HAMP domain-containing histidine kinase [Clostridium sp. CM027]UVE41619.1 HAMP domain-containing histidine kinase [Clostridium sp. CM027]